MNTNDLAVRFKALGDPTRLRIVQFLSCCDAPIALEQDGAVRPVEGPTVGDVCCRVTGVERITSTLSHHLKELRQAGLITMERQGKYMICRINRETMNELSAFLTESKEGDNNHDCCE